MEKSFYDLIKDRENGDLTDKTKAALVNLLGKGCREKTKGRLYWCFGKQRESCGILRRLMVDNEAGTARYCAGQSYPDEIRTIREIFLGRR